jgi:hypothetical protein
MGKWTDDEIKALKNAVKKHHKNWNEIKREYGPGPEGNNQLSDKVHGNRIATKTRNMAIELASKGLPLGIFQDITRQKPPVKPPPRVHPEWTQEQDEQLIEAFGIYNNNYKTISVHYPDLAEHAYGTRLRDRLTHLQQKYIGSTNTPSVIVASLDRPIPGKEYLYERLKRNRCVDCLRMIQEQSCVCKD